MPKLILQWVLVCLASGFASLAHAQPRSADTADLYDSWSNRVLQIQIIERQSQSKAGIGSGFLAAPDGMVITNYHVIADMANHPGDYEARYLAANGEWGSLELVNVDVVHDLAVLRNPDLQLVPLQISSGLPRQGTRLYSMGFPYDIGLTIVEGTYNGLLEKSLYERMHFTGSINPGMSGGPVLNQQGEVIGINVATAGNQVGFLVPAKFASQLLKNSGTEAIDSAGLNAEISRQLQDNQAHIATSLLAENLVLTQLNDYRVAGELADWMSCWGNSLQNGDDELKQVYYQCQSQDDIYLSAELNTGVVRFQHDLISAKDIHPLRFYRQLQQRSHFPQLRLEGSKETVSRYFCQSGFVEHESLDFKSTFCVRSYRKLDGIYDGFLFLTSLVDNHEALQSTLVLAGFSWENLTRLSEGFVKSIEWEPAQP
ncbi:MAG TPA: serine protease [Xanthomonadales bacterium]|nr:serine protease [Xanthomonadales bacterium]